MLTGLRPREAACLRRPPHPLVWSLSQVATKKGAASLERPGLRPRQAACLRRPPPLLLLAQQTRRAGQRTALLLPLLPAWRQLSAADAMQVKLSVKLGSMLWCQLLLLLLLVVLLLLVAWRLL